MKVLQKLAILALIILFTTPVFSQFNLIKRYIQDDVTITEESETRIVLTHNTNNAIIVITKDMMPDSDIYTGLEQRRGGNPFIIWVSTDLFWNDDSRPKNTWGQYFKSSFLRVIRPPRDESSAGQNVAEND